MTTRSIFISGLALMLCLHIQAQDSVAKKVSVPVRIGIFPGLSTQGQTDVHTTSNFSFNLWGGATGSVDGLELASLFNVDKGNVQYVQLAGLFNTVGENVRGVQAAGIFNHAGKNVTGLQSSGIHSHAGGNFNGVQLAGISNFSGKTTKGLQAAGIANISGGMMTGLQAAGIINYARHVRGLQVGLINIADTSDGFHLGLITIVKKGYHKVFVHANEVMNVNVAVKTGNPKLYNILLAGVNPGSDNKVFSFGYGLGRDVPLGNHFSINPEITGQYVYLGNWNYDNWLSKLQVLFHFNVGKKIALTAGPSFAIYYSNQSQGEKGYKFRIPSESYHVFELWDDNVHGWIGWTAGITLF